MNDKEESFIAYKLARVISPYEKDQFISWNPIRNFLVYKIGKWTKALENTGIFLCGNINTAALAGYCYYDDPRTSHTTRAVIIK